MNSGAENKISSENHHTLENQDDQINGLIKQRLFPANENGHSETASDVESKDSVFYRDDVSMHSHDFCKLPASPLQTPQIKSRGRKRKHIFLSSTYVDNNDLGSATGIPLGGQSDGSVLPPPHKKRRRRKVKGYPWGKIKLKRKKKVAKVSEKYKAYIITDGITVLIFH